MWAFFTLTLLLAPGALGGVSSSSLTGRVLVGSTPAPGASVTVSSPALGQPRTTVTNARGTYFLAGLPPGVYDVSFSLSGHTSFTRRAVLELARVARADATLEPSPDEESVTSTATTPSVAETIPITSHFDDALLDRLPPGRIETLSILPGAAFAGLVSLDGITTVGEVTVSEDMVEQITAVRGAAPVEWETFAGGLVAVRTRSGAEDFFFSLRSTFADERWNTSNGADVPMDDSAHIFGEATAGGRIVPQRLWFFAGGWAGEEMFGNKFRGSVVKLDAQMGEAHHLAASWYDTAVDVGAPLSRNDTAALRHTAAVGPRFTSEVLLNRTIIELPGSSELQNDFLSARGSYAAGAHVLTAGFSRRNQDTPFDLSSWTVSDRWSGSRWNVYAGLRFDDSELRERLTARAALTYDLRGDGRHAIAASYGEYATEWSQTVPLRTAALGYAMAFGSSGSARIDALHREDGTFWSHQLQLDARYRLFDRFEAGATYTITNQVDTEDLPPDPEQSANVWLGAELPVGSHEFGATVLQHYDAIDGETLMPTDIGLRYRIRLSKVRILVAGDGTNVFLHGGPPRNMPRGVRVWVRLSR